MKKLVWLAIAGLVGLGAWADELITVQDRAYQGKPFNPEDYGMVQRIVLRDLDAANRWDVYFTKFTLENLGSATSAEIAWVELRFETELGEFVWVRAGDFPITQILLPLPAEQRTLPDDTQAVITVWVGVTDQIVEGHTVKPRLRLWFSEGDEGGEAQVEDGAPEQMVKESSFFASALPGPEGGVLNPGDYFPIFQFQVEDTADVNFLGLEIVEIRLEAPSGLEYDLYNNATRLSLPPGRALAIEDGYFAALDEATGPLTISVRVPEGFRGGPLEVAPRVQIVVREGNFTKSFSLSDPVADTVLAAGPESLTVSVPQGGRVLTSAPLQLDYSSLVAQDADRNDTGIRFDALELVARGTVVQQIQGVEITDSRGNLLAYSPTLGRIQLVDPSGRPLYIWDEESIDLRTRLYLGGDFPVGASLLLEHRLHLAEIHPSLVTPTRYEGVHTALPAKAIFFGQPEFELRALEDGVEIHTTGETIDSLRLTVRYSPTQSVSVVAVSAAGPWRLGRQQVDEAQGVVELELSLRPGRSPQAGKVAELRFTLVGRVDGPKEITAQLTVEEAVDTAGIELPFRIKTRSARFTLTAPVFSLALTEEGLVVLTVDVPEIGAMEGVLVFSPPELLPGVTLTPSEGYTASVLEPDPEAGALRFRLELVPGGMPLAGPLFSLAILPPGEEEAPAEEGAEEAAEEPVPWLVKVSFTGVWDPAGNPLPYVLFPDQLEVPPPVVEEEG